MNDPELTGQLCDPNGVCDAACADAYRNMGDANIGYPDPVNLDGTFDSFRTLPATISVGDIDHAAQADSTIIFTGIRYEGDINGVMAFNRNLADEERRCLYKNGIVRVEQ